MPYFIITAGATGAGKTSLIEKTMQHLGLHDDYVTILIDDLVEQNAVYKKKIFAILDDIRRECLHQPKCIRNTVDELSDDMLTKFGKAYFETRKGPYCVSSREETCDQLNDTNLKEAVRDGKHVVFETQGKDIPTWLLHPDWIPEDYTIVMTFSLVTVDRLLERNTRRVRNNMLRFYVNQKGPAPRLPEIRPKPFTMVLKSIHKTLLTLYPRCIQSMHPECGTRKINHLFLFDNNHHMKLIFDSQENVSFDEFAALISPFFPHVSSRTKRLHTIKRAMNRRKSVSYREGTPF